ncbi:MAG: hypothetical protein V3R54_05600 [Thermodesulfovibrionia bacterium]
MAVKTKKKATGGKTTKRAGKKIKKGARYECSVCGMAVRVDEVCGCIDTCDIICCEKQMKPGKK